MCARDLVELEIQKYNFGEASSYRLKMDLDIERCTDD